LVRARRGAFKPIRKKNENDWIRRVLPSASRTRGLVRAARRCGANAMTAF